LGSFIFSIVLYSIWNSQEMFEDDGESFGLANGLLFVSSSLSPSLLSSIDRSLIPFARSSLRLKSFFALYLNSSHSVSTSTTNTDKNTLLPTTTIRRSRSTRNVNLVNRKSLANHRTRTIRTDWEVKTIWRNNRSRRMERMERRIMECTMI